MHNDNAELNPKRGPVLIRTLIQVCWVHWAILILVVMAWMLVLVSRKQSPGGLITLTMLLAYPLVMLVAQRGIRAYKRWSFASEEARNGAFNDPTLQAIAQAISSNDTLTLRRLLDGKAPRERRDRAGNDTLAYALYLVREKQWSAEPVRVLLDAGADARKRRAPCRLG